MEAIKSLLTSAAAFSTSLFYYVGLSTFLWYSYKALQSINFYVNLTGSSLARYKHNKDPWALITGASDGIGYGFAEELIPRNFNVILLGRNKEKLEKAKAKLARPGTKIQILVIDAISSSLEDLEKAIDSVKDLNITLLVNNVGGLPPMERPLKPLRDFDLKDVDATLYLNSRFMARITRLILPILTKNGPSLVLSISAAAYVGVPSMVMYSGGKAFVNSFSQALHRECKIDKLPIDVLYATPGVVQSNVQRVEPNWKRPTSRKYAEKTLDRVNPAVSRGLLELKPFWPHAFEMSMLQLMPEWMKQKAFASAMKEQVERFEKNK